MKKLGLSKILSLVLCVVLLSSFAPTMTFAAKSVVLSAPQVITGGEGVGFSDNPDAGGSIRGLEVSSQTNVCLRQKEWLKYDLSSLDEGKYQMSIVRSSTGSPTLTISINDNVIFSKRSIRPTGSYNTYQEYIFGEIEITKGKNVLKIENTSSDATYINDIKFFDMAMIEKKAALLKVSRPYKMSYLPCIIQAENFDAGVSDVAFLENDIINTGGCYRVDEPVDIYKEDSMYYVNMVGNEWLTYTVKCKKSGNYDLIMKMVDSMEGSIVRIFMDGYEILRNVPENVMPVGKMSEATVGTFYIEEGVHTVCVKCMDGDVNFDYMRFRDTDDDGIDISNTTLLRAWEDSQELTDEDYETVTVINPVERELYVDASKATNGDGSENSPFNSLAAARDYVRTINKNMKGDIVVNLKGEFKVDKTLVFTEEDSGSGIYNVIYRGDGNAAIHGGRKVTGWKQAENSPLWQTTIPDVESFRQLYIGENRGVPSRSKFYYQMKEEYDGPGVEYNSPDGYIMKGEDFPEGFSKPLDMEMIWLPTWRNVRIPVESFAKTDSGDYLVTYPQPYFEACFPNSAPVTLDHYYYIENAPEFLDEPGEYYFDRDTKVLTYYPFSYEDMNTIDCYIPETEILVKVTGKDGDNKVKNITFEGLEFKFGGWERPTTKGFSTVQADQLIAPEDETGFMLVPAQVQIDFAQNVNFYKNEFMHLGSNALSINNQSNLCLVEGNLFDDISGTTITLGDYTIIETDPLEKYTRKITVKNNLIRRAGVEYMTPLMAGYYVNKVLVDHNDILDAPYTSISMGWGWGRKNVYSAYNKITNNRLVNGTYKLVDGGHVYTLSENKGGVFSGNYIKEAFDWKGAFYLDNATSSIRYFNNVVEDCPRWIKITWNNVMNNTAYNNYSNTDAANYYPDQNSIEDAKGKVNGEWPDEAKEIIANAGLEDEYKYLLENYNARENLRNATLKRQEFMRIDGAFIKAGDFMDGGEGVAYHEILSNDRGSLAHIGGPSVDYMSDGTGATTVMVTDEGEWTKYEFTLDEAGEYNIVPYLAVVNPLTAVTIEIDDVVVADKVKLEPNCTGYEKFAAFNVGTVNLTEGKHTIKLVHAVKNFGVFGIGIEKTGAKVKINDGFNHEFMNIALSK